MKDNETRLATTGVIWGALTLMMVATLFFSTRISSGLVFVMALMFTLAAVSATRVVWKSTSGVLNLAESAEKAKRRSWQHRIHPRRNLDPTFPPQKIQRQHR